MTNIWFEPWGMKNRILANFAQEFGEIEEMMNSIFRTVTERSDYFDNSKPYYYGYQITVGADGKPHIREFGNLKSQRGFVEQRNMREPLVDTTINEKENIFTVTAELPGVTRDDIKISLSDSLIVLDAESGEKKYHTKIPLNAELDDSTANATYSNGILELKIKLKKAENNKFKNIVVD